MPVARRTWLLVGGAIFVLAAAVLWMQEVKHFGPGGGSGGDSTTFKLIEGRHSDRLVEINETRVAQELPGFHHLLEEAIESGTARTRNSELIRKIWNFIEEVSGSVETYIDVEYKGRTFKVLQTMK